MNVKNKILLIIFTILFCINNIYAEEELTNNDETNVEEIENIDINEDYRNIDIINENTKYRLIIEDDANLLSDNQIKDLETKMMNLTEYGNVAFKSISVNGNTASGYASNYYHSKFNAESGTLFLIDMYNREIFIFSDGHNYKVVNNKKALSITDNVYRYASRKDYYNCAYQAFDQVETLLNGDKIFEPMKNIDNILLSITLASFISFFYAISRSSIKRASVKEIINNCSVDFKISNIYAHKIGTHKVYNPRSSDSGGSSFSSGGHSSGGHSSGGHSSGGHSSGGGGGHRF